ncbi:MAG TPA: SidA/IucD/PvdA family monooxygenase, partial [Pseudonocardia sp.]|nr:SidA/IucD/PvdA family monooxygenase [Pseudonocardia sp.]
MGEIRPVRDRDGTVRHVEVLVSQSDGTLARHRARKVVLATGLTPYLPPGVDPVHAIFTRYGYSPADDTAFANRVFDPVAVDHFFVASHRRPGRLRHRLP